MLFRSDHADQLVGVGDEDAVDAVGQHGVGDGFERRVPVDDFDRALTELARVVEADGARLVLVSMPRDPAGERETPVLRLYSKKVLEAARREGLQVAEARVRFQAEFDRGRAPTSLFLPGDFWHPNETGHGLIAETLATLVLDESAGRIGPDR